MQRAERKPFYVQVLTRPALRGCWSVNLSETGMGLIASPPSPTEGPQEGEELDLEFKLPGTRIRVRGLVRWRADATHAQEGATAALGIQFGRFEGGDQVKLARYLLAHRLRVVVTYATRTAELALRAAMGDSVEILFVGSDLEIRDALARGDISAVVVFGTAETRALKVMDQVVELLGEGSTLRDRPREIAPSLIYWAPARAPNLVELFNRGQLFRALSLDAAHAELRSSLLEACQHHQRQIEQRRMGLELERHLLRERARAEAPVGDDAEAPGFQSPGMRRVLELVRVVAPHRVAVLLQGETGTGKEVVARTVHRLSNRNAAAIVVQDCGALPETLLESELFGHVKGAFTGAIADHPGLFQLADGGTIFLDEIENTTPNLQAKLLRVIETGEVRPVGDSVVRQVDVRLVVASNKSLEEEVRGGRFRSDLFYRLNTFTLELPPLRQRGEDVLPLAHAFRGAFNTTLERNSPGFSPEAEAVLRAYPWPGNVRELRNVVERAVLLSAPAEPITPAQLPDALVARARGGEPGAHGPSFEQRMAQAEKEILRDALGKAEGVLRRAARTLQMDPVTLGRRARKLGLWSAGPRR